MEMQFACSGKSFFAMTAQLGQQDVAMNGWLGGDLLQKVLRLVERAEVCADGHLRHMPEAEHLHRGLELIRRHARPSCPTNAGATIAMTFSPPRSACVSWKS